MQKRAARFMTRNYSRETGSMTGIFEELKWEILQFRKGGRIIGSYYCKKFCEEKSKFMQMTLSQNRRCNNQHSMAYQISYAGKVVYKKSFSPQTIRDWNYLPDSLISAAGLSDNCVSKFTSLLRAAVGTNLPQPSPYGTWIPNGNSRCYN